jgi:hypothetical protein
MPKDALEVRMADNELNRRDFIKVTTGIVGGLIGAALGVPAIAYLLDPAFKGGAKEGWVPIGKVADMELGNPYPFSFTRTQVNGGRIYFTRRLCRTPIGVPTTS